MATSALNVVIKSGKEWHEYPTVREYLQDLEDNSLPRSVHDALRNDVELKYHLDEALLNARPARRLEFLPGTKPNDHKSFGTRKLWDNIGSILVYITGVEKEECCVNSNGNDFIKKYPKTVVPDVSLAYGTNFSDKKPDGKTSKQNSKLYACAGHHYDAEWSRCFFVRTNTSSVEATDDGASASQPDTSQPDTSPPIDPKLFAPQAVGPQTAASPTALGTENAGHQVKTFGLQKPAGYLHRTEHSPYHSATSQGSFPAGQTHITQPPTWGAPWALNQAPLLPQPAADGWDREQQERGELDERIARTMQMNSTGFPPCDGQTAQSVAAYQHVFSQPAPWQSTPISQQHGTDAHGPPAAAPQNLQLGYPGYSIYDPNTRTFFD